MGKGKGMAMVYVFCFVIFCFVLRRTFEFDDALVAIHGRMSVCGGAWHMFLGVPLSDGH